MLCYLFHSQIKDMNTLKVYMYNVWSKKIRTTHNLSLWLYEYFRYFWMIWAPGILHFKGLGMKNLQYEMSLCQSHKKVTKTVYVWVEFLWIRCYLYKSETCHFIAPKTILDLSKLFWKVQNSIKWQCKNVWRHFTGLGK